MITTVQFSSNRNTSERHNIDIAPSALDKGSITIICGKNHSGKSYIVKRIHRSISQRNEQIKENPNKEYYIFPVDNIYTHYDNPNTPINSILIYRIALITDLLKGVSTKIENNHKSRKHLSQKSDNFDRIQIKEALELFCFECVYAYYFKREKIIDKKEWFNTENFESRTELLEGIDENNLYLCNRDNIVVKLFEDITKGKLYFGVNSRNISSGKIPEFELRLAFNDDIIIPIGGWSEGQKVLFSIILVVYYIKPQVLIFDEIENHLHPEYISTLLDFIKQNVSQTIITTHHPHIIFSRHVDLVNYLEFDKSSNELPAIIEKKRSEKMKSMKLSNKLLDKNYNKLLSTYKLFDNYDNQLLRISSTSISDLNDVLIELFTSLFTYEIISPKKSKSPDLQSQKLYEIFEKKLNEQELEILEYGAGEGRLLIDIDKITKTTQKNKIKWNLYEPFSEPRKKLVSNLEKHNYRDQIQIHSERPNGKFDFIIIPNVLHELTSLVIADILYYCSNSLKQNGSIIIVELYPLLKPEKYAIPLKSNEWTKLGRELGFKATSNGINFKNAMFEAYFVQLFLPTNTNNFQIINFEKIIRKFWASEILQDRVQNYDGHIRFGDIDELPFSLGNLCTMASILANEKKIWKL